MMLRFASFLFAVALSAGGALAGDAAPFNPDAYPPEVGKSLHLAIEACTQDGGGAVTFAPDTVQEIDLTGDGRDDYIVDFHNTLCADREATYCGTGGCDMDILVTLPNGRIRTVFSDRVRGIEIKQGNGVRLIRFQLHGGYCGGHGNPSCYKEHRMTAKPFKFVMPQ
jgi:hypothetical protein